MHVVMFGDQHVETLGGAQVSMRLQRRFLEKAGHTVTIVAPAMHGARARASRSLSERSETKRIDASNIDLPSIPITLDREYAMSWPGRRADRVVDEALRGREPVDLVHVQADFWGAMIGHRFAARAGLPVVHTMHNRVDVGIEATAPFPDLVLRVLNAWQRRALRASTARLVGDVTTAGSDGWAFLRGYAQASAAVTAPSAHFARRLETHGVAPRVDVIWNGIDDDLLDAVLAARARERADGPARLVWLGRMSPEKRLLPFLEAVALSGVDAHVEVIGGGGQLAAARKIVAARHPRATVSFAGRLTYHETLTRLAAADAVVQTSIGFETQGMTIFEAASLGTPAIVSDPDLAAELGSGFWAVGGGKDAAPAAANPSVEALAGALRAAVADIAAGHPAVPDPSIRERFRQSSRTAAMVEVYDRVVRASGR